MFRSCTIWPIRGKSVQRIGNGKQSGAQRYLFALELARIAPTVESLLMREDDLGGRTKEISLCAAHRLSEHASDLRHAPGVRGRSGFARIECRYDHVQRVPICQSQAAVRRRQLVGSLMAPLAAVEDLLRSKSLTNSDPAEGACAAA
jgi:hypothetical protein